MRQPSIEKRRPSAKQKMNKKALAVFEKCGELTLSKTKTGDIELHWYGLPIALIYARTKTEQESVDYIAALFANAATMLSMLKAANGVICDVIQSRNGINFDPVMDFQNGVEKLIALIETGTIRQKLQ